MGKAGLNCLIFNEISSKFPARETKLMSVFREVLFFCFFIEQGSDVPILDEN
jgi:hypothetical protein